MSCWNKHVFYGLYKTPCTTNYLFLSNVTGNLSKKSRDFVAIRRKWSERLRNDSGPLNKDDIEEFRTELL